MDSWIEMLASLDKYVNFYFTSRSISDSLDNANQRSRLIFPFLQYIDMIYLPNSKITMSNLNIFIILD